jgi:valyl-tRNA synthetase
VIDLDKEIARLKKTAQDLLSGIEKSENRLSDASFLEKAPSAVIEAQRKRLAEEGEKAAALKARIELLKKAKE